MDNERLNFTSKNSKLRKFKKTIGKQRKSYVCTQRFKDTWKDIYPWLERAENDKDAFCVVCCKNIRCKKDDISKHDKGKKHRKFMNMPPEENECAYIEVNDEPKHAQQSSDFRRPQCSSADGYIEVPAVKRRTTIENRPPSSSVMLIRGVNVEPEVKLAITALRSKLNVLSRDLMDVASSAHTELCMRSLDHVVDVLAKFKKFGHQRTR